MTTHNLALPNTVAEVEAPAAVRALDFDSTLVVSQLFLKVT